jgi:hypothetical protein
MLLKSRRQFRKKNQKRTVRKKLKRPQRRKFTNLKKRSHVNILNVLKWNLKELSLLFQGNASYPLTSLP